MPSSKPTVGVDDLATEFPELAKEADGWDPKTVSRADSQKRAWRCHLGHEYKTSVSRRTRENAGCPYCSGRKVLAGFNDLATVNPKLAKEADGWDTTIVTGTSGKKKSWRCALGHTWEAVIANRAYGAGCPYCTGRAVLAGFNDLQTTDPEVAKEADGWDPTTVSRGTKVKKDWRCQLGHSYQAQVTARTRENPTNCPYCSGQKALAGFNDLATSHPDLAKEAHGWNPSEVTTFSAKMLDWKCKLGHTFKQRVFSRTRDKQGCPYCSGQKVLAGFNDFAHKHPSLAKEADGWDPTTLTAASHVQKLWKCPLGHPSYKTTPVARSLKGVGCPRCVEYGFNPGKPSWFYLLKREGEQQLGVTNSLESRLQTHSRSGWSVVELVGPADGELVISTEKKFKHWLKQTVGLVPNTEENWFTTKLEVRSLAELKAKSGVETDLF